MALLNRRSLLCLAVIAANAVVASSMSAQASGVLVPKKRAQEPAAHGTWGLLRAKDVTNDAEVSGVYGKDLSLREQADFALIMSNPQLSSPLRTSAWTANVVADGDGSEVKLQANLCDMGIDCSKAKASSYALLAGPLDKKSSFSDVVDLNGMLGTTRAELGGAFNLTDASWKPALTFKGALSLPQFAFFPTAGATPDTVRHANYSAGVGLAAKGSAAAIEAGWRYENTYEGQDPTTVCTAITGSTALSSCKDQTIGAPSHNLKSVWNAGGRLRLSSSTAVALTVSHDQRSGKTGYSVPLWFVPDPSGGPGAGIRGGYRTDTRQWSASVFLGVFKL